MRQINHKFYKHPLYGQTVAISNGTIDIDATLDVGPRIIRFGFCGQQNEFCDDAPLQISVDHDEWHLRGGHRLWCSPELFPRTYWPDNQPVQYELLDNGIRLVEQVPWVQVKKEMEVILSPDENKVSIQHRIRNQNAWDISLAVWALSVMAPGGFEVIPQACHSEDLTAGAACSRILALWSYTRMNDPRVYWGDKYITLRHDARIDGSIKFGTSNEDGWAAYFNHGNLFIKRFDYVPNAAYPDHGVSYETITTDFMLEMESLSPLVTLQPEKTVAHQETWELVSGVACPGNDEKLIDQMVSRYIKKGVCL